MAKKNKFRNVLLLGSGVGLALFFLNGIRISFGAKKNLGNPTSFYLVIEDKIFSVPSSLVGISLELSAQEIFNNVSPLSFSDFEKKAIESESKNETSVIFFFVKHTTSGFFDRVRDFFSDKTIAFRQSVVDIKINNARVF